MSKRREFILPDGVGTNDRAEFERQMKALADERRKKTRQITILAALAVVIVLFLLAR